MFATRFRGMNTWRREITITQHRPTTALRHAIVCILEMDAACSQGRWPTSWLGSPGHRPRSACYNPPPLHSALHQHPTDGRALHWRCPLMIDSIMKFVLGIVKPWLHLVSLSSYAEKRSSQRSFPTGHWSKEQEKRSRLNFRQCTSLFHEKYIQVPANKMSIPHFWRPDANIMNEQSRTADRGWSSSMKVRRDSSS